MLAGNGTQEQVTDQPTHQSLHLSLASSYNTHRPLTTTQQLQLPMKPTHEAEKTHSHTAPTLNTTPNPICHIFTDLLVMFSSWEITGDKLFVVHHLVALYAYSYLLVSFICFITTVLDCLHQIHNNLSWSSAYPMYLPHQEQGVLPYFANFRLMSEFSTPCVNQR